MDIDDLIRSVALYALPVLFAITLHEAGHAYVAKRLGDDTAWRLGRVTLNPASHIDPVGTILMPLLLYFGTQGQFVFGFAKPVPVRFGNLRHPKRDSVWVALAGPMANFIQALVWGVLLILVQALGVTEPFLNGICRAGVSVNLVMFAFNLFPLPPLDGGRILVGLLPYRQAVAVASLERWGFFIVMALVWLGVINDLWMRPVMLVTSKVLHLLLLPFAALAS